ncbi:AMP-binding protein [Candidatus Leptofilum sp.]|uniref:AMP-binding protein n=1 Tax=Candidatus Leptofilum sp. TaxID=3241576 RepID=UPI003B5B765D
MPLTGVAASLHHLTRADFSWYQIHDELDGLPEGKELNIAHETVDRHANGPHRHHLALRWLGKNNVVLDFTYADLKQQTNRFANVLQTLGIEKGDRIFCLAGRIPSLYIAALGTLKNRSVFCPLFSAFGPEPIFQRMHKLDIDSFDFLNFLIGLEESLGVSVPEADYDQLVSLKDIVGYVSVRMS